MSRNLDVERELEGLDAYLGDCTHPAVSGARSNGLALAEWIVAETPLAERVSIGKRLRSMLRRHGVYEGYNLGHGKQAAGLTKPR